MISKIADNIQVLAEFGPKGIKPRVFVWERRRRTVTQITRDLGGAGGGPPAAEFRRADGWGERV